MKKILFILALLCSFPICSQAQLIKEKAPVDPKYLAGAVPVQNGMVTFSKDIPVTSLSAKEAYNKAIHWLGNYFKKEEVLQRKSLERDSTINMIKVGINEYIVFKNTLLVLDRSQMIYSLEIKCKDGICSVTMSDISYYYDEERDPIKYTAEKWITDENALNKKKTKLSRLSGKFRVKTIDTFEEICNRLTAYMQ